MIGWIALAAAGTPTLTAEYQPAWTTADFASIEVDRETCTPTPIDDPAFPAGLPIQVRLAYDACGQQVARVDFPMAVGPRRSKWYYTPIDGIADSPPRRLRTPDPADTSLWLWGSDRSPGIDAIAVGSDHPGKRRLPFGLRVKPIDPALGWVVTPAGHSVVVDPNVLRDEDPTIAVSQEARRNNLQKLRDGWVRHSSPPVQDTPAADDLLRGRVNDGVTFWFRLDRKDLTWDRAFSSEWLDPVGQRVDVPCDDAPTCGSYWLDYSALGAWWPTRSDQELLVTLDGTMNRDGDRLPRLRVLVINATAAPGVTPDW